MKRLLGIVGSVFLVCGMVAATAHAETTALFLSAPTTTVQEGDHVSVDVFVRAPNQSINAVSGTIVFPESLVSVVGVSKANSIISLWTREPSVQRGRIVFEGVVLNPGFQGSRGAVFHITFEAKKAGAVRLSFANGAVLANDGYGSNIASTLGAATFTIKSGVIPGETVPAEEVPPAVVDTGKISALPVITDFSAHVDSDGAAYVKGKGEPNALTRIEFKNTAFKSIGEQFIAFLQTKKQSLDSVIVKNDAAGSFEYTTPSNIIAGAYNATPYLVDTNTDTEKPGLGVQLFVSDSQLVRLLVIVINVLALLIPVVGLGVIIYFIPWYSFKRMRVLGKRFGLEEEKLKFSTRAFEPSTASPPAPPVQQSPPPAPPPVSPAPPPPQLPVVQPPQS